MKTKKLVKVLASAALVATAITVVACSDETDTTSDEAAVNRIILDADGTTVSEDFTVVTTALGEDVSWSSSDENVVSFHEVDDEMYACIVRPSSTEDVTLTATVGTASKDFTVIVNPVTVDEIADDYDFTNDGASVSEDFDLDSSYDYVLTNNFNGDYATDTATITWTSSNDDVLAIATGDDGLYADVASVTADTDVDLTATFTYDDTTIDEVYSLTVTSAKTDSEMLDYFYESAADSDTTFTIYGYVLTVGSYSSSYGDTCLTLLDQTLEGGYYCYYTYMDEDTYNSLEYGTRVEIVGCTSTTYSGLVEAKGGDLSLVTDDDVLAEFDTSYTYNAIDNLLALEDSYDEDDYSLIKQTGTMVSVTSWYVYDIDTDNNEVTLTKGDLTVTLCFNTYVLALSDDDTAALEETMAALSVGDYVSVTGILTYYNGWEIALDSTSSITTTTDDSDDSIADGEAIASASAAVEFDSTITEDTTVDTSTFSTGDVAVTYALADEYSSVTLADGVFTFTPTSTSETVVITATFTSGDTTLTKTYTITVAALTDEDEVETEIADVDISDEYSAYDKITLSTSGSTYSDVTLSYSLSDGATNAEIYTDSEGTYLIINPSTTSESVTLTVTATLNDATKTSTVDITIDAYTTESITDAFDGALTTDSYYYVSGVVISVSTSTYGTTTVYIAESDSSTIEFEIYSISDIYGTSYSSLTSSSDYYFETGYTVTFYGKYSYYSSGEVYELKYATIVSVTAA